VEPAHVRDGAGLGDPSRPFRVLQHRLEAKVKRIRIRADKSGADPERICYLAGELIDDHHTLVRLITEEVAEWEELGPGYLLVDEVTYIRDWDKGVKFLADAGTLEDVVLMLSGSDSALIRPMAAQDDRCTNRSIPVWGNSSVHGWVNNPRSEEQTS
jgi:hypothetical protein